MFSQSENPAVAASPKLKQLQSLYSDAVREYLSAAFAKVDSNGNIVFIGGGGMFFIICDETDLSYFRLLNFIKIDKTKKIN